MALECFERLQTILRLHYWLTRSPSQHGRLQRGSFWYIHSNVIMLPNFGFLLVIMMEFSKLGLGLGWWEPQYFPQTLTLPCMYGKFGIDVSFQMILLCFSLTYAIPNISLKKLLVKVLVLFRLQKDRLVSRHPCDKANWSAPPISTLADANNIYSSHNENPFFYEILWYTCALIIRIDAPIHF